MLTQWNQQLIECLENANQIKKIRINVCNIKPSNVWKYKWVRLVMAVSPSTCLY